MQFYTNIGIGNQVYSTAPAINSFSGSIKGHSITVETFDFGTPMGWGEEIRRRAFINGILVPMAEVELTFIWTRKRPEWLPKNVTIKAFRELVAQFTWEI